MSDIASGNVQSCQSSYPVTCDDIGNITFETCTAGMLSCNEDTGGCPFFFKAGATQQSDLFSAALVIAIAIVIITFSLFLMGKLIRNMLVETPIAVIARMTDLNYYVSMFLGCSSTLALGSSSLIESALNPFLASGVIEVEQVSGSRFWTVSYFLTAIFSLLTTYLFSH